MAKQLNTLKKGNNLFKFYSFAERISMVNLDIFRSAAHLDQVNVPLVQNETYFLREMEALRLSADASFRHLYYALKPWTVSLPMILFHIKDIIKALLRFLDTAKPEVSPCVFSLIGILARDMRSEFYPYFDIVLRCYIAKIDEWKGMPEQLEALFTNLARQFKYLERLLLKDIKKVFMLYKEFFVNNKEHVRQFAAESFAYLLRKLKSSKFEDTVDFILSQIPSPLESAPSSSDNSGDSSSEQEEQEDEEEAERDDRTQIADGIGFLLFYVVQGIKHKYTTASVDIVPLYFSKLTLQDTQSHGETESEDDDEAETSPNAMEVSDSDKLDSTTAQTTTNAPTLASFALIEAQDGTQKVAHFDAVYLVLLRFIKATRKHFHNNDCPLLWSSLIKAIKSLTSQDELSLNSFKCLGYLFSLAAEWLSGRHLPGLTPENQKSILDNGLELLNASAVKTLARPTPGALKGDAHARETLHRLAMEYGVRFSELMANEHSSAAAVMARKSGRDSLAQLFSVLESFPSVAFDYTLALQHTSIFKHFLLPLTLQFVDNQLKTETKKKSASSSSAIMLFVYRLVKDLAWGQMIGAANINIATESLKFPSDKMALLCLSTIQELDTLLQNKKSDVKQLMSASSSVAPAWMALKIVSHLTLQKTETLTELDSTISSLIDTLGKLSKKLSPTSSTEASDTSLAAARQSRNLLAGEALLARCNLSRVAGPVFEEESLQILQLSITQMVPLLQNGGVADNWHLIRAFSEIVYLAISEPYGSAQRYSKAKKQLQQEKEVLEQVLEQAGALTSHFDVQIRMSSWKLLKSLSLLDAGLVIHRALTALCTELTTDNIDPLAHKSTSAKFSDVVDLASQASATPFDRSLAIRFLLGVLYVQLTPLWPPAIKALTRLHDFDSKTFWAVCTPLLQSSQAEIGKEKTNEQDIWSVPEAPEQQHNHLASSSGSMDIDNDEAETVADEFYLTHDETSTIESNFVDEITLSFRFTGASTFSDSLWNALTHAAKSLAPSSPTAATLFDQFLEFISKHFPHLEDPARMHAFATSAPPAPSSKGKKPAAANTHKEAADEEDLEVPEVPESGPQLSKTAIGEIRKFLTNFLRFFGTFKNVLGVKKADKLFHIFLHLAGMANEDIQLGVIQCLCLWKDVEYIIPYRSQLETIIRDARVRTPLTEFPLLVSKGVIAPGHRADLIPLITRLLFPKLTLSKTDAGRRGAVLAYLAQCEPSELKTLFKLTLGQFDAFLQKTRDQLKKSKTALLNIEGVAPPQTLSLGQITGSLRMIYDMVKSMGVAIQSYLPDMVAISLMLLDYGQSLTASLHLEAVKFRNPIRKLAVSNLNAIMGFFDAWNYQPYKKEIIRLLTFEAEATLRMDPIVTVGFFLRWCETVSARALLIEFMSPYVETVISLLKRTGLAINVRSTLFTIIENLLKVRSAKPEASSSSSSKKSMASYDPGEIVAGLTPKQRAKMDSAELHAHITKFAIEEDYRRQNDVLMPFSNDLLDAMQIRLFGDYNIKKKVGMRELGILEQLTVYATSSSHADKLATLLLPYAKQRGFNPDARLRILSVFSGLIPLMTTALTHLDTVKRLFQDIRPANERLQLVRILAQMAKLDPALVKIVPLIEGLNAMNAMRVDEPDYEKRMAAYTEINETLVHTLTALQLSFIVANYLHFVPAEDLSIRNNAVFGLTLIIRRIAAQYDESGNLKTAPKSGPEHLPLGLVSDHIMSEVKKQLNSTSELTRREFLGVMAVVIENLPVHFEDLVPALGANEDSNFFICVHHLQSHRRVRILVKLTDLVNQGKFNKSNLLHVFFPVLKQLILSATQKHHSIVDEAIKAISAIGARLDWKSYYGLIQAGLKGMEQNKAIQKQWIKLLCSLIDTFHYDIGKEYLDIVEETKPKSKSFSVVSKQDNFDEETYEADLEKEVLAAQQANGKNHDGEEEDEEEEGESGSSSDDEEKGEGEDSSSDDEDGGEEEEEEDSASDSAMDVAEESAPQEKVAALTPEELLERQIQRTVLKSLLPTLVKLSKTEDKENKALRTNVIVSAVRLLNRLPESMSKAHISRFVIEAAGQLASRSFANRIAANATIQEILKVLGPTKFLFILDVLTAQLRRGFQLHILCSTVHTLLKALQPLVSAGEIDDGLHMLNKIFFEELLGQVAEQKTVKKITSATTEAAKTYAFDSMGIVAQLINFDNSIRLLVDPIFDVILASTDVKVIKKMTQLLDQISIGIRSNSSVTPEKLCVFVYQLMDQYSRAQKIEREEKKTDAEKTWMIEANPYKQGTYAAAAQVTGKEVNNDHMIVAYALQILFSLLKSSRLSPKNPDHRSRLDPFVAVIARHLRSRHDDVLVNSLRCLTSLLKYPLPSIEGRASKLAEATVQLMQKANSDSNLMKMCFKSLARILAHSSSNVKIADTLYMVVIGYVRETFETDTPQHGLELFKSLVGRRVLVAEMYDAMKRVNQLLVHTRISTVRLACEQIIAQFLLTYPLDGKRLDQQLEFVMANLTFPESSGRLAIVQLLKSIFARFPEQLLNARMQYFFLPLVAQMVNDDFAEVRSGAALAIETLYAKVSSDNSNELLQTALNWYESDDAKVSLQRAAAQLICLFAGKLGAEKFSNVIKRLIPTFAKRLEHVTSDFEEEDMETLIHVTDDQWQGVYFTLLAIEKSVAIVPSYVLKSSFIPLWKLISSPQLLGFPHPWVKLVCSRLLGAYFAERKEKMPIRVVKSGDSKKSNGATQQDWLAEPRCLFNMTKLCCNMLPSSDLSEELGTQVVKNLYWLALQLQEHPELTPLQQIQASVLIGDAQIDSEDERGASDSEDDKPKKKSLDSDDEEDLPVNNFIVPKASSSNEKKKKNQMQEDENSDNVDERETETGGVPAVTWIFKRLSYMTKELSLLAKSCVFKFFAAVTMSLDVEDLKRYSLFMLFPLFRANEVIVQRETIRSARDAEGKTSRPESPESVAFAELVHQVAELLRKKIGTTAYYELHERVRARVMDVRRKRKSELAVEAVVNPAKHALRKAARHEKSKQSKKRKIDSFSAHRTTHRMKVRKTHE